MTSTHVPESARLLAQLAQPTAAYKRRVWLAVTSLVLFIVLYFLLAAWFVFTAYRLTLAADTATFAGWLVGFCALFLAVFMLKPVFFVKHGDTTGLVEVTPQQQPRLFAFLDELADGAAAPRPHRVFLSPFVNACVFYDLSILNLLLPSKKNLEIGLGLVNALTLGECRAVLAHEFGHFTQRSMAVMRWAYVAQQIAAYLVARRDKLDAFLERVSRSDFRVAWVAWSLSLIVWSIRSLVDTAFRGVVLLQRALSREMEFQADLVAVSLTGSDALIHALHRLQAADDCWERTLSFAGGQHSLKRTPQDVFAIHSRVLERVGPMLSDPEYGRVSPVPAERPDEHRVFTPELALPPRMWLTHPLNHEREANAKRRYVPAPIDASSAWTLFDAPDELRRRVSAVLLAAPDAPTVPVEESLAALNDQFDREPLRTRYRGIYFGRSVARAVPESAQLIGDPPPDWRSQLERLYPLTLIEDMTRWRNLENEIHQLRAIEAGALTPPDGVIRHRGRTIKPRELAQVIASLEQEARAVEDHLCAHDRLCRTVHWAAAQELGGGWAPYLRGLLDALHFADHTAANLQDLAGLLGHTVQVATVTRRVSSAGRQKVIEGANALQDALADVVRRSPAVKLDATLLERLHTTSWSESLGKFSLPRADETNLGQWLDVVDGWVNQVVSPCILLRQAALEQLLLTEAALADHIRSGTAPGPAPSPPSSVTGPYERLLIGAERKRDAGLSWWQRFQIADGVVPTVARIAAAAGIVALVLGFGSSVGTGTITVYNGLARSVVVSLNDMTWAVGPGTAHPLSVAAGATYRVVTRTAQEQEVIDSFDVLVGGSFASFVYNVAGATPLIEWTAVYGNVLPQPERRLGTIRWSSTTAEVLFEDPPASVRTSGGGASRLVLSGMADADPGRQLFMVDSPADREQMIRAHARWDPMRSRHVVLWLANAQAVLPDFRDIVAARLRTEPRDVVLLRTELDGAPAAERGSICDRHRALAAAAPEVVDLAYVASRCISDSVARNVAFEAGHARWPTNGWFAYAAGYNHVEAAQWRQAIAVLDIARTSLPAIAEYVTVDLARIHRFVDDDPGPAMRRLSPSSIRLRSLLAVESGSGADSGATLAYTALMRGDIDRALALARSDSVTAARVLRLAASSDGASRTLVGRALALEGDAGLDDDTRWASLALAVRMGRDFSGLVDSTETRSGEYEKRLVRFIQQVRAGTSVAVAEKQLRGLPPVLRGHAYSMGVIVLGRRAPASWRRGASRLLFAPERPYFK